MLRTARPRVVDHRALLAYTSLFEKVVKTAVSATAQYGALTAVAGASGSVTVTAPAVTADLLHSKAAFHFGVVNYDGAQPVVVSGGGVSINGGSSLTLPAFAGAFAFCWLDLTDGTWKAMISGGAGSIPPPSYTAQGGSNTLTGTPTAVTNASITTAAFSASQKAIIIYATEFSITAPGIQDTVTMSLFDGVASSPMHTWRHTVGNSAVEATAFATVSVSMEVLGNGSPRTFGLAVSEAVPGSVNIPSAIGCVGVVQIVDA